MSVPRENATTGQRLKALEQEVARLRLQASSTVTTVAPTDAMPRSTWIDPSANNAPYFLDDSGTWIPVRDGNIAVAQATANSALAASTDGLPPASSPAAELIGGIGALFIRWPAVANANPVTYKVYVDTTTGFTPGAGNLVGQTVGTFLTVRTLTAGTALTYGTTYYAKIVATDADGAAAAGVEGSGAMVQVNSPDIAANSIIAGKIAAGTIVAGDISTGAITTTKLAASAVTATEIAAGAITAAKLDAAAITGKTITGGLFRTATSGSRVEIDSTNWANQVRYYTGNTAEVAPGIVQGRIGGDVLISEPDLGYADLAQIRFHHPTTNSRVEVISTEFTWLNSPVITTDFTQTLSNKDLTSASNTFVGRMLTQCLSAACTANLALQTVEADIAGATVTFTTVRPNARYMAMGSFYFASTAASNNVASGKLAVDGAVQAAFANFTGLNTTPDRTNAAQSWAGTLAAAGSHTLKLRGVHANANNVVTVNSGSTTITVLVFE